MKKILLIIVLLIIATFSISCNQPKPPGITSWYQREIIGQGNLVSVDLEGYGGNTLWLIAMELQRADTGEYETAIYQIGNDFTVSNNNGDYIDTKKFQIGHYYVLYRKLDQTGQPIYHLSELE